MTTWEQKVSESERGLKEKLDQVTVTHRALLTPAEFVEKWGTASNTNYRIIIE